MNLSTIKIRQLLAGLGAGLAVLVVTAPAGAQSGGSSDVVSRAVANRTTEPFALAAATEDSDVIDRYVANHATQEDQTVIPYLSHGILEPEQSWQVIPYLSHGMLSTSDLAAAGALRDRPDGFQPDLHRAAPVASVDSGIDWETTGFTGAAVLAAALLALMSTIALRNRRGPQSAT